MPVRTSKQAIQANTAPAKNKWANYKQNKTKSLQSTEVFKHGSKDTSVDSIFASIQVTSTRGSYFAKTLLSVFCGNSYKMLVLLNEQERQQINNTFC